MILILMVEGASAMLISGRTCTPTPSCPEAPPCTPVSPTECRRRPPPWLPPPSRSRSLLPPRGSTLSGSEDPSWPRSPPSSRCGSPSRSTTSADPPLSTASASNSSIHTDDKPAQPSSLCNIYQYQGILCPDQYQWICKNIEIYELKKKKKFEERERDIKDLSNVMKI